jgi:nucleotide-binding universal stress UspA family protein
MKSEYEDVVTLEKDKVEPLRIYQALVGLSLESKNDNLPDYLGFIGSLIPIDACCFLHVLPKIELFENRDEDVSNFDVDNEIIERITNQIHESISKKAKTKVKFDIREGNPLDELLEEAENRGADFVVIGKSTKKDYHGILAKNFARKANGHALLVPDKARQSLKRILVPVDFSPSSVDAIRMAVAIKKRAPEIEITALNIYELPSIQSYMIRKRESEIRTLLIEDRQVAFRSFLESALQDEDAAGIKTNIVELTSPSVGNLIMDFATSHKSDMIVMGAKGHSKIGLLLLGSVTEKVMTLTKRIPVLIVK